VHCWEPYSPTIAQLPDDKNGPVKQFPPMKVCCDNSSVVACPEVIENWVKSIPLRHMLNL